MDRLIVPVANESRPIETGCESVSKVRIAPLLLISPIAMRIALVPISITATSVGAAAGFVVALAAVSWRRPLFIVFRVVDEVSRKRANASR